mmetsp:Transcript_22897/g.58408  ORF Transcript_22897/g.58408 Transcript_22897/m.58408 type:complete len:229 (-) Transcript_22897:698-1384(-)
MHAPLRLTAVLMTSACSSSRIAPSTTLSFMQILITHLASNVARTRSSSASSLCLDTCTSAAALLASTPPSDTRNSSRWEGGQSERTLRMGDDWWKLIRGPWGSACTMTEKENLRLPSMAAISSFFSSRYPAQMTNFWLFCSVLVSHHTLRTPSSCVTAGVRSRTRLSQKNDTCVSVRARSTSKESSCSTMLSLSATRCSAPSSPTKGFMYAVFMVNVPLWSSTKLLVS